MSVIGLDKAKQLMPLIEAARAQGTEQYRAALAEHGVTTDQVRQWRSRLKKKSGVTTTQKPASRPKAVTPKIKKISADETRRGFAEVKFAIEKTDRDDSSVEWMQRYQTAFEAACTQHPEWLPVTVKTEAQRIARAIHGRTVTKRDEETAIRIRLTKAQMEQVRELPLNMDWKPPVTLVFRADEYEERAKKFVLTLEERIEDLNRQLAPLLCDGTYMDWNNKEDAAVAHRKQVNELQGARKACEGAIRNIVHGDDSHEQNILDWYEPHNDERLGIA